MTEALDKPTLEWVLKRIHGYENDDYYEYCHSLETLKSDVEIAIEKGIAWDEEKNETQDKGKG